MAALYAHLVSAIHNHVVWRAQEELIWRREGRHARHVAALAGHDECRWLRRGSRHRGGLAIGYCDAGPFLCRRGAALRLESALGFEAQMRDKRERVVNRTGFRDMQGKGLPDVVPRRGRQLALRDLFTSVSDLMISDRAATTGSQLTSRSNLSETPSISSSSVSPHASPSSPPSSNSSTARHHASTSPATVSTTGAGPYAGCRASTRSGHSGSHCTVRPRPSPSAVMALRAAQPGASKLSRTATRAFSGLRDC